MGTPTGEFPARAGAACCSLADIHRQGLQALLPLIFSQKNINHLKIDSPKCAVVTVLKGVADVFLFVLCILVNSLAEMALIGN